MTEKEKHLVFSFQPFCYPLMRQQKQRIVFTNTWKRKTIFTWKQKPTVGNLNAKSRKVVYISNKKKFTNQFPGRVNKIEREIPWVMKDLSTCCQGFSQSKSMWRGWECSFSLIFNRIKKTRTKGRTKVSTMRISIPLDLSSRSFIPLPRFIRSRRPTPLLAPSLVLFPPRSV